MPSRSSKPLRATGQLEKLIADRATDEVDDEGGVPAKNPHAVALGRMGGKKGGHARAQALSGTRRKEIAERAAAVRWAKHHNKP